MMLLFCILVAYIVGSLPIYGGILHPSYYKRNGNGKIYLFLFGILKGVVATLFALFLGKWFAASLAAIFVVLGSMYSFFQKFRGDNGVAVATGALFVLSPLLCLIAMALFLILHLVTRAFDLSTLITTIVIMIIAIFFVQHSFVWIGTICLGVLILVNQKVDWHEVKKRWKFH